MLDDIKNFTAIFSSQLDLHTLGEYALDRVMKGTGADAGAPLELRVEPSPARSWLLGLVCFSAVFA